MQSWIIGMHHPAAQDDVWERLHPLVGARGLDRDSLFQLAWRDIHAAVSQITMAWDIQAVNAGRIQFGLPSLDPRL